MDRHSDINLPNKSLFLHIVVFVLFFGAIVFRLYPHWFQMLKFLSGGGIGFSLLFVDRIVHVFWADGESELSLYVRNFFRNKKFVQGLKLLLKARSIQTKLTTRSVVFLVSFLPLSIFVLTSTGSLIGTGLIFGLGLHLVADFFSYAQNPQEFKRHFLWQIKREVSDTEVRNLQYFALIFFIFLTFLFVLL